MKCEPHPVSALKLITLFFFFKFLEKLIPHKGSVFAHTILRQIPQEMLPRNLNFICDFLVSHGQGIFLLEKDRGKGLIQNASPYRLFQEHEKEQQNPAQKKNCSGPIFKVIFQLPGKIRFLLVIFRTNYTKNFQRKCSLDELGEMSHIALSIKISWEKYASRQSLRFGNTIKETNVQGTVSSKVHQKDSIGI